MYIEQQNGLVSTVNFTPYSEAEEYQALRKMLFEQAKLASNRPPKFSIDNYDETILVFDNCHHALSFMTNVFRAVVELEKSSNYNISLRSSLCHGDYYLHDNQVYGDAVNLATRLSFSSRENELLVCGVDPEYLRSFLEQNTDLDCFIRDQDSHCVSIGLNDNDSTIGNYNDKLLKMEYDGHSVDFNTSRNQFIELGRSSKSDIVVDNGHTSRHHATIRMNYDEIYVEDHSSNGTYVYFDNREVFIINDSMEIGQTGAISCGIRRGSNFGPISLVNYQLRDNTRTAA